MKLIVAASVIGALLLPAQAMADSPFDGTWKGSYNGSLVTYKVDGGSIAISTPSGLSNNVKMDGTDAAVTGNAKMSSLSVSVKDPNTLMFVSKLNGKVTDELTETVSADGKTLTAVSHNTRTNRTTTYKATKQ